MITFTQKEIDLLLTAAGRAPSGGNCQPWLVEISDTTIIVKLNPQKLGQILDVNHYGSHFALGAFAQNLELAAKHLGLQLSSEIIHASDPNHFSLKYTLNDRTQPKTHPLYFAVLKRDTNRQLAKGKLISPSLVNSLQNIAVADNPNFRLDTVSSHQQKTECANILGVADRIRTKNYPLLKQMLEEIRWTPSAAASTLDGVDIRTMELPGNVNKMLQLLSKFASLAKIMPDLALEKQAWPLLKNSSHLCLLSFKGKPNPNSFFQTGYVMEHLWLEATLQNLSVHPWTVITFFIIRAKFFKNTAFSKTEEADLIHQEKRLHQLFNLPQNYTPAFIFRLSQSDPPSRRSMRYPWSKFTSLHLT
jgi:hypothetical protein